MEHSNKFDLNRERRAGNNFWKRGLGLQEHRASEIAAKAKRLDKAQSDLQIQEIKLLIDDQGCNLLPESDLKKRFEGHLDSSVIEDGISKGKLFKGVLRIADGNRNNATVMIAELRTEIFIDDVYAQN